VRGKDGMGREGREGKGREGSTWDIYPGARPPQFLLKLTCTPLAKWQLCAVVNNTDKTAKKRRNTIKTGIGGIRTLSL